MGMTFRKARRDQVKPIIGLYAESGCGKTYSALLLARGFVGAEGRIGMIETESGRGEAYADLITGGYDVLSMREDFSPRAYGEAISAAEESGVDALIIDSASHEWEGLGGVIDMAARNQEGGKKGVAVWQTPKIDHQRHFMLRLLQTPIKLVIICMRAKYPMEQTVVNGKKDWTRSTELVPKQSEDILYELFVHGWIDRNHCFRGTKYTRPDLREVFRDGVPLSLETGVALATWSRNQGTPAVAPAATTTLDAVLGSIAAAATIHDLSNAALEAKGLPEADKVAVRDAYRAKREALTAAELPATVLA